MKKWKVRKNEIFTPEKTQLYLFLDTCPGFIPDYQGIKGRKFEFDWANPERMIAVEYEGYGAGHLDVPSYTKDCLKYNLAQDQGWRVHRVTAYMWKKKQAHIDYLMKQWKP